VELLLVGGAYDQYPVTSEQGHLPTFNVDSTSRFMRWLIGVALMMVSTGCSDGSAEGSGQSTGACTLTLSGGESEMVGCTATGVSAVGAVIIETSDDPRYQDIYFAAHVSPTPLVAGNYPTVSDGVAHVLWATDDEWNAVFHYGLQSDYGTIGPVVLDFVSSDGRVIHGTVDATLPAVVFYNGTFVQRPEQPQLYLHATF